LEIASPDVKALVERAKSKGLETPHTRREKASICEIGRKGLCCNVCSEGPCRITEKHPYGVCGLNADQIVAKNLLRHVSAGVSCYVHVCENTARALMNSEVKDKRTLEMVCDKLGIDADAKALAEFVLADIHKPRYEKSDITLRLAPKKRLEVYEKLGIVPGGAKAEIVDALVKTSTNLNANVTDMLFHVLRLGLTMGYTALRMNVWMNDIILGTPSLSDVETGIGAINPNTVNIMTTGHQSALQHAVIELASSEEMQKLARDVGAEGINVVGATCVGQDIQSRWNHLTNSCFIGQCANNFGTEPLVASGLIDAVVSEFNCTFPGLTEIAKHEGVKLLAIDDVALIEGAELISWSPERSREMAREVVLKAIESFKSRKRERFGVTKKAKIGFTEEFVEKNMDKILEILADGKIKGVSAVVGCSNLVSGGHDVLIRDLTKELLKRDIIVWTAGCTAYALQGLGFMSEEGLEFAGEGLRDVCEELGLPPVWDFGICMCIARIVTIAEMFAEKLDVDLPDLPVVASAPQWLEEQALGDGAFALSSGFLLHVYPDPFVSGSKLVSRVLTEELPNLTGGRLLVEGSAVKTAEIMERHIVEKRKGLGLKPC
jgi:carbon-monoxide dehydrogenase catalytic subunit